MKTSTTQYVAMAICGLMLITLISHWITQYTNNTLTSVANTITTSK